METDAKPFRIAETADLLVGYTGNQPLDAASMESFLDRWAERLEQPKPFGVILVYEASTGSPAARDAQAEDAYTRVMSEFRRNYRARVQRRCTGFSRVFPAAWLAGMDTEQRARYAEKTSRFAEYLFGVRGADFTSLTEARGWLETISRVSERAPLDSGPAVDSGQPAGTVGLYYGSTTGTTEFVVERLRDAACGVGLELSPVNISDLRDPQELLAHDRLIVGLPTWNVGQLQDDWLLQFPKLDTLDFSGKQVALFGVGDQVGYPDNFLDALGILGRKLQERGATLIGLWPTAGYTFAASKAQVGDRLLGLGLDEYNQEELTDSRLEAWVRQIQREFGVAERPLEYV